MLLNAIQKELGSHVPIQDFFDLIVGTRYVFSAHPFKRSHSDTKSTGGIVALGLGVKRWGVEECMQRFKELCPSAFTRRSYPAFKHIELLAHKSWYKTKPLESALQSAFGEELLFGGPTSDGSTDIRVAVTSTTASEFRPVILTNYNTREDDRDSGKLSLKYPATFTDVLTDALVQYESVRPLEPTSEITVWQAARATAAAPIYFKSFVHSGIAYSDGAIHHNCPAIIADSERRRIWDEVSDWPADFVLSLGSGLSRVRPRGQASALPKDWEDDRSLQSLARQSSLSGIRYGLRLAFKIIDDQLNCEKIWSEYVKEATVQGDQKIQDKRRNMRINVPFNGERPALDAADALQAMEDHALSMVKSDLRIRSKIHEAAHRLVASCFYFEVSSTTYRSKGSAGYTCTGKDRLTTLAPLTFVVCSL